MGYHVGVTASRYGLTAVQHEGLENVLKGVVKSRVGTDVFLHHGDCVGGDEAAHAIALKLLMKVVIHPPENDSLRAFCKGAFFTHPEKPYLDRNRDIVWASKLLLGCPHTDTKGAGGTWYTINQGLVAGINVITLRPNGGVCYDAAMHRSPAFT